jgi:hypothetical protein
MSAALATLTRIPIEAPEGAQGEEPIMIADAACASPKIAEHPASTNANAHKSTFLGLAFSRDAAGFGIQ